MECKNLYRVHTDQSTAQRLHFWRYLMNYFWRLLANIVLVLLDMSAAFDTVNHNILLQRLENSFGITGSVNTWLRSYFTGRYQCVNIGGCSSNPIKIDTGMPQGSILGPKGYPSYVSPLFEIVRKHSVNVHMYADDTPLYLGFNLSQNGIAHHWPETQSI